MSQRNKDLVRRGYETLSAGARKGNLDEISAFVASDIRDYNAEPGQAEGIQGVKDWFLALGRAFPDLNLRVKQLIAEGDQVVARIRVQGTHGDTFLEMPPTGRRIDVEVIDILTIRGEMVTERRGLVDQAALIRQLGEAPSSQPVEVPAVPR